jgi:hypothetical protein
MMSHAVNKKPFSNGSKSVEDEKKSFLNHFNLSKKSGEIQYNSEKNVKFLFTNKQIQEHLKLFELNECIS